MKRFLFLIPVFFILFSCTTYKEYVTVQYRRDIPDGIQHILINADIDTVEKAFINEGLEIKLTEDGFKTKEMLVGEGTRAIYKANRYNDQVKVAAYWSITQQAKSQMVMWAGSEAAKDIDVHKWYKVEYESGLKRPKRVFDYLVQIIEENNLKYTLE